MLEILVQSDTIVDLKICVGQYDRMTYISWSSDFVQH